MVQKVPPPPLLTSPEWQSFNRWLLELTAILNAGGGIDPGSIAGLDALVLQVATNTSDIAALQTTTSIHTIQIAALTAQVATNTTNIAALQVAVTALQGQGEILNGLVAPGAGLGKVNDWYADTVALHIYVKTAPATWTLIV